MHGKSVPCSKKKTNKNYINKHKSNNYHNNNRNKTITMMTRKAKRGTNQTDKQKKGKSKGKYNNQKGNKETM